eukprot:gene21650-49974_t
MTPSRLPPGAPRADLHHEGRELIDSEILAELGLGGEAYSDQSRLGQIRVQGRDEVVQQDIVFPTGPEEGRAGLAILSAQVKELTPLVTSQAYLQHAG